MPSLSHTVSFEVPDLNLDLTQKVDISLSTSRTVLKEVNEYLLEAKSAFREGEPFPSKFEHLSEYRGNGSFPFESADGFKLVAELPSIDSISFSIAVLGGMVKTFPEIDVVGKIYNIKPLFGKRNMYMISSPAGNEVLTVRQHFDDAAPGDTQVASPVISDS